MRFLSGGRQCPRIVIEAIIYEEDGPANSVAISTEKGLRYFSSSLGTSVGFLTDRTDLKAFPGDSSVKVSGAPKKRAKPTPDEQCDSFKALELSIWAAEEGEQDSPRSIPKQRVSSSPYSFALFIAQLSLVHS